MGDRYTITAPQSLLAKHFNIEVSDRYEPRYNAAPTQILPIITQGSKGLSYFFWGQLPERSNNKPIGTRLLYVPAESLRTTPSGRRLLDGFRCLIPADGYYAWRKVSKKGRIPHRIVRTDNSLFSIAGIWEEFEDDEGQLVHTFRMVTTNAIRTLTDIAPTMPLILDKTSEQAWLSAATNEEDLDILLSTSMSNDYRAYTVSPRIENPDFDKPTLINPFSPADQFGNYSLFD